MIEDVFKKVPRSHLNDLHEVKEAVGDTLLGQPKLKPLKPVKMVKPPKAVKPPKPVYNTYEDYDFETLQQYAGLDVIVTSELLAKIFPLITVEPSIQDIDEQGIRVKSKAKAIIECASKVEMFALDYIIDMELNGIKYDIPSNEKIGKSLVQEIGELEDSIFSRLGKKLNLDSALEVSNLLYGDLGFKAPIQTKSGDDSTNGDSLLTLAGLSPTANIYTAPDPSLQFLCDMAKRKDLNSVHNTFIKTYVKDWVKRDGRIHPSYNLVGTSGFRISGDSPNLLQLPRPKHGYNIRTCYGVEEDEVFVTADFSSAEVKVVANLCKDANMMKAISEGLDFHSFSASMMLGIDYREFYQILHDKENPKAKEYKRWRQVAKVL